MYNTIAFIKFLELCKIFHPERKTEKCSPQSAANPDVSGKIWNDASRFGNVFLFVPDLIGSSINFSLPYRFTNITTKSDHDHFKQSSNV